jgi:hypothetical protein
MGVLCLLRWCTHVTRHNMSIHIILSTAPQLSISQKPVGTLPEDGNVVPKHVGTTIHNKLKNNWCIWVFTHIFTGILIFKGLISDVFISRSALNVNITYFYQITLFIKTFYLCIDGKAAWDPIAI